MDNPADDMLEVLLAKELEVKVSVSQVKALEKQVIKHRAIPSFTLSHDLELHQLLLTIYEMIEERSRILLLFAESLERGRQDG